MSKNLSDRQAAIDSILDQFKQAFGESYITHMGYNDRSIDGKIGQLFECDYEPRTVCISNYEALDWVYVSIPPPPIALPPSTEIPPHQEPKQSLGRNA